MAFPSIVAQISYASGTTDATTWTPFTNVAVVPGELLVFIAAIDGIGTISTTSTGWTMLGSARNGSSSTAAVNGAIFYKFATTTTETLIVRSSTADQYSGWLLRVSGAEGIKGANANGSSTNSNPPALNTAMTGRDHLWIATRQGDSTITASACPPNYSGPYNQVASGTSGASTTFATRTTTTSTEDPSTFVSANEQWVSWTLGIYAPDSTPPTITSTDTISNPENSAFSQTLTANETVTWSIVGGSEASLFALNGAVLTWANSATRDYENPQDADANNTYVVVVRATDAAGNYTDQTITVTVTDKVDETPPFITSAATQYFNEASSFTLALQADETVTWSKVGGADQAKFSLSGANLTIGSKDYSAPDDSNGDRVYVVTVRATDTSGNWSEQTFSFNMVDTAPVVNSRSGSVQENRKLAHTLQANQNIALWEIVGGEDADKVMLDGNIVRWAGDVTRDYENPADDTKNNLYSFFVRATDPQGNVSAQTTIGITVTDQSDETPAVITSASRVDVLEGAALSHSLTANETVLWSKVGGADGAMFTVSGSTLSWFSGVPDFEAPLDANGDGIYEVVVRATDTSQNISEQLIKVRVTDVANGSEIIFLDNRITRFRIPQNVTSLQVHCFGASGSAATWGGGSGGAYAADTAVPVTPGSIVTVQIGSAGSNKATWFVSDTTVKAACGSPASGATGGVGGRATDSVGAVVYSGGNGGNGSAFGGGGGGGAAGPDGDGKNGGLGYGNGAFGDRFGGGGGGCSGGQSTAGGDGASNSGGLGGTGPYGSPGLPWNTNGSWGNGAGGTGGFASGGFGGTTVGFVGSLYPYWSAASILYGPGAGGGGGASGTTAGSSQGMGGGAGGGASATSGGPGGIVILFNDADVDAPPSFDAVAQPTRRGARSCFWF